MLYIQIVSSEGFVKIKTKLGPKYNLKSIVTGSLLSTFFLQKMVIFGFSNSAIDKRQLPLKVERNGNENCRLHKKSAEDHFLSNVFCSHVILFNFECETTILL